MIPPEPTLMVEVPPAIKPIKTEVAVLATLLILLCSANQYRLYPQRSACCTRSKLFRIDSPGEPPAFTIIRSRIDKGISYSFFG